jgi:uncharacterized protein YodC (DUF2158 family)
MRLATTCEYLSDMSTQRQGDASIKNRQNHSSHDQMSTTQFVKGWVVKLKSGGPLMTVTGHETDEYGEKVYCQWFGDKNKLEYSTFDPATLSIISQD